MAAAPVRAGRHGRERACAEDGQNEQNASGCAAHQGSVGRLRPLLERRTRLPQKVRGGARCWPRSSADNGRGIGPAPGRQPGPVRRLKRSPSTWPSLAWNERILNQGESPNGMQASRWGMGLPWRPRA